MDFLISGVIISDVDLFIIITTVSILGIFAVSFFIEAWNKIKIKFQKRK